jgi:N-acetylglutamate synthase-like GNAT family acetyltransferase
VTYTIKSPQTDIELQKYYDLRWRILRAPWQQLRGSERDEYETMAIHAIATDNTNNIVGVARLHQTDNSSAQIRYMAVECSSQKRGIGKALLHFLEEQAEVLGIRRINLNARENCVGFYIKQGYHITGPGPVLYGEIKHQKMQKLLR